MTISYRVVWVNPKNPDTVMDYWEDDIDNFEFALDSRNDAIIQNAQNMNDCMDWVPRIQKVTTEFI